MPLQPAPGGTQSGEVLRMFDFTWRIDGYEVRTFEEFGHKSEMLIKYILVRSDGGGEMRIPANLLGPLRGHPGCGWWWLERPSQ